ncbi:MAG: nicotinate (nicotinamide) nucleotide adenylyltransferase [Persicimonas sp.]
MSDSSTSLRRSIGLYGGSFNPPHVCHTLTTVWAMQTHSLDEVWWVPTYQHAFSKDLVSFEHRRRLCQLALRHIDGAVISDIEREMGGESRTVDTVRALSERYPSHDYSLIVGSDILEEADRWKDWEGLMEMVDLIVIGRAGHHPDDEPDSTEFRLPDISSTETRRALREGDYEALRYWLSREVIDYIAEHGLYREQ